MLTPVRLEREFNALAASEASSLFDLFLRISMLCFGAFVVGLAIDQPAFYLLWAPVYAALGVGNYALIRGAKRPVTRWRFWLLLSIGMVAMLWLGGLGVYLSYLNGGAYLFLGYSICIGIAIYALTSHTSFCLAAMRDLTVVGITAIGVALTAFANAETRFIGLSALLGGLLVLVYFFFGFRQTIQDRLTLQQREMAKVHDQKLKSLGQLTSGVAHDFNNLLTVVGGNVELAMLEATTQEQYARLQDAKQGVDRGATLVTQLLAYSRKAPLNESEVHSADVLAKIREIAGHVVPERIETTVNLHGEHALLLVDAALLETAILNLMINSRDALGAGYGMIRVNSYLLHEEGQLAIAVEDTGPGMDRVTMERATEPFFTTKGPGEGTGLGLSMVKGFAEQSGGTLVLARRVGGGLVATILLPVFERREVAAPV